MTADELHNDKETGDSVFSMDNIINTYRTCGLSVMLRASNKEVWDATLLKCTYIPVAYTNMNIDFLLEHQHGNGIEIYDLSVIICWDNKPVAVWPLFLSIQQGVGNLNFLDNNVLPPLIAFSCKESSEKQIVRGCFRFADTVAASFDLTGWSSMESFIDHIGFSSWHISAMGTGAKCILNHEVFLDLRQEIAQIKAGFRKSFKSLINSGQKLWSVSVMDHADTNLWNEFLDLHVRVAGRKTRSDQTWAIHYNDILKGHSFLVYLRDKENSMVGAGLFNWTRDEGLYAVGAYDRSHFDKPVGHVVQYRAIEELKKRNVRWYKLGARPYISQVPKPSEKEISIGEFKQGFSSHIFPRIVLEHRIAEIELSSHE